MLLLLVNVVEYLWSELLGGINCVHWYCSCFTNNAWECLPITSLQHAIELDYLKKNTLWIPKHFSRSTAPNTQTKCHLLLAIRFGLLHFFMSPFQGTLNGMHVHITASGGRKRCPFQQNTFTLRLIEVKAKMAIKTTVPLRCPHSCPMTAFFFRYNFSNTFSEKTRSQSLI